MESRWAFVVACACGIGAVTSACKKAEPVASTSVVGEVEVAQAAAAPEEPASPEPAPTGAPIAATRPTEWAFPSSPAGVYPASAEGWTYTISSCRPTTRRIQPARSTIPPLRAFGCRLDVAGGGATWAYYDVIFEQLTANPGVYGYGTVGRSGVYWNGKYVRDVDSNGFEVFVSDALLTVSYISTIPPSVMNHAVRWPESE